MLELGSSKHWQEALAVLTGEKNVNAEALIEYFKPLHLWLIKENAKYGITPGF